MYSESMVDIETLDTGNRAVVLSIGAVLFNPFDKDTYEVLNTDPSRTFYAIIAIQPQLDLGRTVSASTLFWWTQQNRMAQKDAFREEGRLPVEKTLADLHTFLGNTCMWGNGSVFDNVIIDTLFEDFALPKRPFWMARDLRTLKAMAKIDDVSIERGVEHNAIEDAKYQVLCAQEYWRSLYGE